MQTPANTYTVQPGDTLYSLAKRFNASVKELRELSDLKSDGILIGQKLEIPARDVITTKATILGVVDSASIEIIAHHVTWVLEVSYGSSQKFSNQIGKKVTITFTKGNNNQRPALISVDEIFDI
ncbi:LysM peptidoglycan-binding domain-containing protein [Niallia sp. 01092]|uniref:LysM peptidoglycan-binding domain-containing protein n=1 Tax=unclassified Niallia TaxID=2837522 RepID=UPI003FCEF255